MRRSRQGGGEGWGRRFLAGLMTRSVVKSCPLPRGLRAPAGGGANVFGQAKQGPWIGSHQTKLLQLARCAQGHKACLTLARMFVFWASAAARVSNQGRVEPPPSPRAWGRASGAVVRGSICPHGAAILELSLHPSSTSSSPQDGRMPNRPAQ